MRHLVLILGCGATKRDTACSAAEMYLGSLWQTLRANVPSDARLTVLVMSACHGLIHGDTVIEPYDQCMTAEQADCLAADPEVRARAGRLWAETFGPYGSGAQVEGYMVAGEAYVAALERILPDDDCSFEVLGGSFLTMRAKLKHWLTGRPGCAMFHRPGKAA